MGLLQDSHSQETGVSWYSDDPDYHQSSGALLQRVSMAEAACPDTGIYFFLLFVLFVLRSPGTLSNSGSDY